MQEKQETQKYLDKDGGEQDEKLTPDYQEFLDNDDQYRNWLDELNEQAQSPF